MDERVKPKVRILPDGHRIITGDCLDVLKQYPDDSVDLVITSPPYEDARTYGIDFSIKGQEWVDWSVERFAECYRISRGLVAWNVQGKTRNFQWSATPALLAADLHRRGIKLRNPAIFHRVGIPGSGGPDWFRSDYEWIVCASKGKLPWSDNTACGHPPKWAPGGEMSHRLSNGARVNQWGHSVNSGATVVDEGGVVRSRGRRPSHSDAGGYDAPVKANPGNVIFNKDSIETIISEVICYGYASKECPGEVLRSLRKAIDSQEIFQWCSGVSSGLFSAKALRPHLFWDALSHAHREAVLLLHGGFQSEKLSGPVLLEGVLGCGEDKEAEASGGYRQGQGCRQNDDEENFLRDVRERGESRCPSHRRESTKQFTREPSGSVPGVSRKPPQSEAAGYSEMQDMWSHRKQELQEVRDVVRHALPKIQEAWISLSHQEKVWEHMGGRHGSDVRSIKVGGGLMGSKLAHENEAPFPESLPEFFIKSCCPPGGTVLDPFGGSGTTLAAAVLNGRIAHCIDIRESQADLMHRRYLEAKDRLSRSGVGHS